MMKLIDTLKTRKLEIVCILLYIIAFSLINQSFWSGYDYLKYSIIVIIGIYLLFNIRILLSKDFRIINILLISFSVLTVFLSYLHRDTLTYRNPFLASIVFVLIVLEIFGVFEIVSQKHKSPAVLDIYFKITAVWCIFLDLCVFLYPQLIIKEGVYIVGTKFQISYINILFIALFLSTNSLSDNSLKKNMTLMILLLLGVSVSIKVNCMTGVVGTVAIIVLYVLFSKKYRLLRSPVTLSLSFVLCGIFPFICGTILSNSYVQKIITEIFNRTSTLTGREIIYQMLPDILKGHLLTGYGVGSEFEVFQRCSGFPNSQNGVMSWVLEFGLIATLILISALVAVFYYMKDKKSNILLPLVLFVYTFILIGTVEICFYYTFYGIFAIILCFAKDDQFWSDGDKQQ